MSIGCWMGCHSGTDASLAGAGEPVSGQVYCIAADGDDGNSGTQAEPWRTFARALPELRPGDTLYVRGTIAARDVQLALAGTAQGPITIASEPGQQGVVDGGFQQFRRANNQEWELVNEERQIYRSVARFPGAGRVFGYLGPRDGGHRLVPYESLEVMCTNHEDYREVDDYFYVGPGVFWDRVDERIYVRMVRSRYQSRLGFQVPSCDDPRRLELLLFPEQSVFEVQASTAHLVLDGLRLVHGGIVVDVAAGCHHLTMRRCALRGGRYEVVVRGGHHFVFDELQIHGGFPAWVARSDVKRPSNLPPARQLQGTGLQIEGRVDEVEIANSAFTGLFDAIDTNGTPTNWRVHHNTFSMIRDDVFEIATAGHHIEFDHNTVTVAASAVSWNWSGSPPANFVGTKYIHHNVIDTSQPQLYGRDDPLQLLPPEWRGPNGDGMATGRAFNTHNTASLTGADPWKVYQNTIVGGVDVDGDGLGVAYRFAPFDRNRPHEVFNNILVQIGDHWLVRTARVADGSQIFDGNVYFRSFRAPTAPLLADYASGGSFFDFARLVDFKASTIWPATRGYYPPGWEAAGLEGDPGLDASYRPAGGGPAGSGAVDLTPKGWPGVEPVAYRGALPPR